jgi:hypothetical protein
MFVRNWFGSCNYCFQLDILHCGTADKLPTFTRCKATTQLKQFSGFIALLSTTRYTLLASKMILRNY